MSEDRWQPQPLEVWREASENMDSQIVRDILRSWQYERDMIGHDIITPLRARAEKLERVAEAANNFANGFFSKSETEEHYLAKMGLRKALAALAPNLTGDETP